MVPYLDIIMNIMMFVLATVSVAFASTVPAQAAPINPGIVRQTQALRLTALITAIAFVVRAAAPVTEGSAPFSRYSWASVADTPIAELLQRVDRNEATEVVLATNPTMTGEATAVYIADRLRERVRVTRLASGLPVGGDLEYADEVTLGRAFAGRRDM